MVNRGFTLPELLLVVILLGCVAMAMQRSPLLSSFTSWRERQRLQTSATNLVNSMAFARSLASGQRANIQFCGNRDCQSGWGDTAFLFWEQTPSTLLKTIPILESAEFDLIWKGFPIQRDFLLFTAFGSASYQNGSFFLCGEKVGVRVRINQSGRAYIDDLSDSNFAEVCP